MRGSIVVLTSAVLVACSGGGTGLGEACGANQPCDPGQVCDLTNPGGPVCLDGTGDVDGDGIPNDKDFCEHRPGGAFDEDGDGIGDECDACPIARPPAIAETDGDGVDSPCDPNPTMPGDKIVLFNGFNEALPATWAASAGWKVMDGQAIMTPTNPATTEQLSGPVTVTMPHVAILAGYRIDSVAPGGGDASAGVVGINRLPLGDTAIRCGGSRSSTVDQLLLETDVGFGTKPFTNVFDPASPYRIAEQIEGANANCALVAGNESGAVQSATGVTTMNQVGLFVRGATARFAYLLVVSR